MNALDPRPSLAGQLMASEAAEGPAVFARAATADHRAALERSGLKERRAIYTIARGSSDAAANILSYEIMRELGIPATSLPPSVFSLGGGVDLAGAAALVISQSGASTDLAVSTRQAGARGAVTVAMTNRPGSPVEEAADATLPIGAGTERAVPATKSVIGSIGTGMSMIAALCPAYAEPAARAAEAIGGLVDIGHPDGQRLTSALLRSQHVYVIGRDCGFGAAQEVALKLKECCALHAEAYSSSEVLHGPLQLVTRPVTILMLDIGDEATQDSMDVAEARFQRAGATVLRVRPGDVGLPRLVPAAAAAALLHLLYPVVHSAALALGHDPDRPETLAKETLTL